MTSELAGYYGQVAQIHGLSAIPAKVCLLAVMGAIAGGNKRPGQQLLTAVFAAQFAVGFWIAITADTPAALPAGVICLVLALALGLTVLKPEGQWNVAPKESWRRWAAWIVLALAFWYPPFTDGWLRPLLFSPMAVLPQPVLLAAGAIAWGSLPNTPRLAGWSIALGLVAVGVLDMMAAASLWAWLSLLAGGILVWELYRCAVRSGGVIEDDIPPVDRAKARKARKEEGTKEERVWKLK
ncbi:hypothetical protein HZA57_10340 [Candidatus Poribacteria bacterium]|nr:hypothetical protein [Candidatus Poribacteria bacterium]